MKLKNIICCHKVSGMALKRALKTELLDLLLLEKKQGEERKNPNLQNKCSNRAEICLKETNARQNRFQLLFLYFCSCGAPLWRVSQLP